MAPIKVNNEQLPKVPELSIKAKLKNKLQVSPLDQELKLLGPVSSNAQPHFKEPVFTKYSHREIVLPTRKISPSTQEDPDKPSLIDKGKAKKLLLLQKTIKSIEKKGD